MVKITTEKKIEMLKEVINSKTLTNRQILKLTEDILITDKKRAESKMSTRGKQKAGKGAEYRVMYYTQDFFINKDCAKRVPASGSAIGFKGDVVFDVPDSDAFPGFNKYLIDNKKTSAVDSLSFRREWMDKIKKEALESENRIGIITFEFHSSPIYVAMEYEFFLNLLLHLQK